MINFTRKERYDFCDLQKLVTFLRSEDGCPWDRVQTHSSIRRNLLEEAYEACEGIDLDDAALMREEFGDVLLQVVFHTSIEEDAGRFTMDDVCDAVCKKLIFRHPHLFAQMDADAWDWEEMKKQEKGVTTQTQILDNVARSLPALIRAEKISGKMGKMDLGWLKAEDALDYAKAQLEKAPTAQTLGSVLFALTGACKALEIDPEDALHKTCEEVIRNFAREEEHGTLQNCQIQQFLPCEETEIINP